MYHVTVGSDTYGRVKKVGSTPIVTEFGMVSFFPVFPLESFYFVRFGHSTSAGIPFFAQTHSTAIEGIPLARVDKLSVEMAYARGVFGAMAIVGFIGTFMILIEWMTGDPPNERKAIIATCVGTCLGVGIVAGFCTYICLFTITRRERNIRRLCGTILGVAADPAQGASRLRGIHSTFSGRIYWPRRGAPIGARTCRTFDYGSLWERLGWLSRIILTTCLRESGFKRVRQHSTSR